MSTRTQSAPGLNKSAEAVPRVGEGKRTTSIRPISLRRAKVVTSHLQSLGENVTDFISNAVDARARKLVDEHKIQLPEDCAFIGSE